MLHRAAPLLLLAALALPGRADAAGSCVDDVTGRANTCTANDVQITDFEIVQNGLLDVCTGPGDTATLLVDATLIAGASERYDIGIFVATDGGDARAGACYRDYLPPPCRRAATTSPAAPGPSTRASRAAGTPAATSSRASRRIATSRC
jgi:hypothetical protein